MKKLFQFVILISMSLSVSSCYYDSVYEATEPIGPDGPDELSYQADILPLWGQCVGCHNGSVPPNLEDAVSYDELLNGYVIPGDSEASILYKSLLGIDGVSLMPPGSQWPDTKINAVKDWIDQGALNN